MGKRTTSLRHFSTGAGVGRDKPRKYKNKPVWWKGIKFDSGKEFDRYQQLLLLEAAGKVSKLELKPKYPLTCGGTPVLIRSEGFPNGRKSTWTGDFRYRDTETGETVVEDVKGYATYRARLKIGVVEAEYGIRIMIVR